MTNVLKFIKIGGIGILTMAFTSCASEELGDNAMQVGVASHNLMYDTVLYNIAMVRYYATKDKAGNIVYNKVIPVDTRISAGQDVVNDTAGVTASAALGGAHGLVVPNISLPYSHSVQQQANSSPSSDGMLLSALMDLYCTHAGDCIFHSESAPPGTQRLSSHFLTTTVWVNTKDIGQLSQLVLDVLGHAATHSVITPDDIYTLRQKQNASQSNKVEDAAATSIRAL